MPTQINKWQALPPRFWAKVRIGDLCWTWQAGKTLMGYGVFWWEGRLHMAHRVSYQRIAGPIPDGWEIDHLCRNPACVNPAHLEAVTPQTNQRRGFSATGRNARKTHCKRGHPFDEANTHVRADGKRNCRACAREADRRRWVKGVGRVRGTRADV